MSKRNSNTVNVSRETLRNLRDRLRELAKSADDAVREIRAYARAQAESRESESYRVAR